MKMYECSYNFYARKADFLMLCHTQLCSVYMHACLTFSCLVIHNYVVCACVHACMSHFLVGLQVPTPSSLKYVQPSCGHQSRPQEDLPCNDSGVPLVGAQVSQLWLGRCDCKWQLQALLCLVFVCVHVWVCSCNMVCVYVSK